jgi:hypothetical protein
LTSTGSGTHDGSSTSNRVVSAASDYALAGQPAIASVGGRIVPLVLVGDSINYPTIPAVQKSPLVPTSWLTSIQPMNQSRSLSAEVATLDSGILASSNDSENGMLMTILDGGVRMPDDRKDH